MPRRYTIRAFARIAGVTVKALYHYDRRGLLRPARTAARYRTYTDADFRKLREIQALRFLGFTLTQIKSLLRGERADILEAIHAQRLTVERRLKQLARASKVLAESETYLRSGDQPYPLLVLTGRAGWAMAGLKYGEGVTEPRPPDRVTERKRAIFHRCAGLLDADPSSASVQAAVREWNAMIAAEIDDDPETIAAVAQGWKRRAMWPDGVRQWVASLYETDAETWTRVADLIDRANPENPLP